MTPFATRAEVKAFLRITGTDDDALIDDLLLSASGFLQQRSGRQFEPLTETRLFSTEGRAYLTIPDLRTASAVTLSSAVLTANQSYWLIPSRQYSTIYTGIQLRAFDTSKAGWYKTSPEWFDRNYDSPRWQYSTLPLDLSITGDWGWQNYPDELRLATKALVGFWIRHGSDGKMANVVFTPEGAPIDYSGFPIEVRNFLDEWSIGERAVSVG